MAESGTSHSRKMLAFSIMTIFINLSILYPLDPKYEPNAHLVGIDPFSSAPGFFHSPASPDIRIAHHRSVQREFLLSWSWCNMVLGVAGKPLLTTKLVVSQIFSATKQFPQWLRWPYAQVSNHRLWVDVEGSTATSPKVSLQGYLDPVTCVTQGTPSDQVFPKNPAVPKKLVIPELIADLSSWWKTWC